MTGRKRFLSILMAVLLVLALLPVSAGAATQPIGEGAQYAEELLPEELKAG